MYDIARMQMYEIDLWIEKLNPVWEIAGIEADCLACNNVMTLPHTSTAWGHIKKRCDGPIIHECILIQQSRMRTGTYELTNNTWDNIDWDTNDGYTNDGQNG